MIFGDELLADDGTLSDYNIQIESKLNLVVSRLVLDEDDTELSCGGYTLKDVMAIWDEESDGLPMTENLKVFLRDICEVDVSTIVSRMRGAISDYADFADEP